MKTAIFVTIHSAINFGSVLQTFATEKILQSHGFAPRILNYRPSRLSYRSFLKRQLISIPRMIALPLSLPVFILNRYIYNGFLKRYCHLTKPYYSIAEIEKNIPKADVYITGSDQVWNSTHNNGVDEVYYYTFLPSDCHVVAFSSSFGKESMPTDEAEQVKKFLSRFKHLSVREHSAKVLLDHMGFHDVVHLMDPTLLLDRKMWHKLLIKKRMIKQPYLLIFTPYNTVSKTTIYHSARKIANTKGLQIVTFSWNILPERLADKTMFFSSPEDFLSLMYHAYCVITNSFHGTAFAINLNRPLWVYEPSSFSTRILSILELTGLRNRLLADVLTDDRMDETIDYFAVNQILDRERAKAYHFLHNALNQSCI